MSEEIIIVEAEEVMEPIIQDYQKYELDKSMAIDLAKGLPQVLTERATLLAQVDEVLAMDKDDPKTAKKAAQLRIAIKHNRTQGVEKWRKTSGEVFFRVKQFVDAIGKKESFVNEQAEEKLEAIEKHAENLEKQRLETLHQERLAMVAVYVDDVSSLPNLSGMDQEVFEAYLQTKKNAFEAKIAAEKKAEEERLERERKLELFNKRKDIFLPLSDFWPDATEEWSLGDVTEERFNTLVGIAKANKVAHEVKQESIRLENIKLKEEADKRESEAKKQREIQEAALAEERKKAQELADKQQKEKEALELQLKKEREATAALEAKKQADMDAEKLRLENLAKAGDKAILVEFLERSFVTPKSPNGLTESGNAKVLEIVTKFDAFRRWALTQIEA